MNGHADGKDLTIGLLSTTAVILLVGLVVVHSRPGPALAVGATVATPMGEYVMSVGAWTSDEEVVYVTDSAAGRMIVFRFNSSTQQIDLVQGVDLAEMRRTAEAAATKAAPIAKP